MAGPRRPATRQTESVEPHVTRQTRQSAKRAGPSVQPEPQQQNEIFRGDTSRHPRRSLEGKGTRHTNSELESLGSLLVKEPAFLQESSLSESGDAPEPPEIDADRIQDMLDFDIPKLTRWSDKLYGILSSHHRTRPDFVDWKKLSSYRKSYNHACLPFAGSNTSFISPMNLSDEFDRIVQSRIQVAICSGNLVSLLASLLDVEIGKKKPIAVLRLLDNTSPAMFIPHFHTDSDDIERILDLALRVRCRLLVDSLMHDESITSFEEYSAFAANIFCGKTTNEANNAREALDKGPYRPLAGMEMNKDVIFYEAFRRHVQELISKLFFDNVSKLQMSLDPKFTQISIFNDVRLWALGMYQQLNGQGDQDRTRATNENHESQVPIEHEESESLFVDNYGDDSDSVSDIDAGGYNQFPSQVPSQNYIDNSTTLAAVRESEKKAPLCPSVRSPSDQQFGKEIEGKETASSSTRDAIRLLDPIRILDRTRKRSRPDGNSDSQDDSDGFEVNEQLLEEPRRVRGEQAAARGLSPVRVRFSKQHQPRKSRDISLPTGSPPGASSMRPLDDLQDDCNLQGQDILVLSQNARNSRRANYSTKARQTRTPWSAHDTSRLVDLIADPSLNCSWSAMEKAGGFEHPRNQQALRDKARGLKVWYLEGDRILPPGFDQVALGQKEKDSVIKCGRNPDRREDDMDENGQITSNIWIR